jgi:hypothetical protein
MNANLKPQHAAYKLFLALTIFLSPATIYSKCPAIHFKISGTILNEQGSMLENATIAPFFNDEKHPAYLVNNKDCVSDMNGKFECEVIFFTSRNGKLAVYDVGNKLIHGDDCGGIPKRMELIISKNGYPFQREIKAISDNKRDLYFENIKLPKLCDPSDLPPFSDMK